MSKATTKKATKAKIPAKAGKDITAKADAAVKAAEAEVKAAVDAVVKSKEEQTTKTGSEVIEALEAAIEAKTAEIKAAVPLADTECSELPPAEPNPRPREASVVKVPTKGKKHSRPPLVVLLRGRAARGGRVGRTGRIDTGAI